MHLNHPPAARAVALLLCLTLAPEVLLAQKRIRKDLVYERNVRAEMNFLASDALQGRASATNFERIAAEYIGSQFRQFGLEPGGDKDASGAPGFVQRVQLQTVKFSEPPTLRATGGGQTHTWQYGRDLLANFVRSPHTSGKLQVINADETPAKGAFALVRLPANTDRQKRQEVTGRVFNAHAAGVVFLETDANK